MRRPRKVMLPLLSGTPLFQTVQCDDAALAGAMQRQLAGRGILVRHYAGSALLRFGLPAQAGHWQRLDDALGNIARQNLPPAITG